MTGDFRELPLRKMCSGRARVSQVRAWKIWQPRSLVACAYCRTRLRHIASHHAGRVDGPALFSMKGLTP